MAMECGIATTGRKPEVAERLATHIQSMSPIPASVISLDLGYRNLAFCHMDRQNCIHDWGRVDLELPDFHPSVMAPIVRAFVRQRLVPLLSYPVEAIVIERQRMRSGSSHAVLEHIIRVNYVEALLWCELTALKEKGDEYDFLNLVTMSRVAVERQWKDAMGPTKTYHERKKAGAAMVQRWLEQQTVVHCHEAVKTLFLKEKKKDDMADALMQALTWYECSRRTLHYKALYE
ncbi:hypothetical protein EC973_003042 [Apophysomyces ossiformis]|uniref:Mitochondrial resolvase Ydc2 catalytic domain-containing protein n=1 Tax=Apophysomyces ossiformis TaxID=679940 RepID=A0A8H7EV14_9FUNG|nr:hypothetical protein EC973_003042 [Apophysomyces ossiformis]